MDPDLLDPDPDPQPWTLNKAFYAGEGQEELAGSNPVSSSSSNSSNINSSSSSASNNSSSNTATCDVCATPDCDGDQLTLHAVVHRTGCRYECRYCLQVPYNTGTVSLGGSCVPPPWL
jgi:hypothetical protein